MSNSSAASTAQKRLAIVTGVSGSGKSVALATFEDEGFFCIDNLPGSLLLSVVDRLLASHNELYDRMAIGIDVRSEEEPTDRLRDLLQQLKKRDDVTVEVLFLDTDRSTLVRRFSETRRKHPLSTRRELPLMNAIDQEARLLEPVKEVAELVIDTSALNLHELRDMVRTYLIGKKGSNLSLIFQSFGFKHGTPASTDFMFDVRCLQNPYWEPELREYTGLDKPIIEFLDNNQDAEQMYQHIERFLAVWLPEFAAQNRAYLTVSIGCTGGRHRSVYLAERLASHFDSVIENVSLRHRELT